MHRVVLIGSLLTPCAGIASGIAAQQYPASAALVVGLAPERDLAGSVRLDVRGPALGRIAPTASIGRWYRQDGCDQVVGAVCDGGAWAGELGVSLALAHRRRSVLPYTTLSLGRLFPDDVGESASWYPAVAAGLSIGAHRFLGLQVEVRYTHALVDDPTPVRIVDAAGRFWLHAGVRVGH